MLLDNPYKLEMVAANLVILLWCWLCDELTTELEPWLKSKLDLGKIKSNKVKINPRLEFKT